ncbi:MAG: cysteine desulfurase, partial [Myxococcota bacterium]
MIYLDNGATTPMDPAAVDAMVPFFSEGFGNASSLHHLGARSARAVREARSIFAEALGGKPDEIVFTGGGTEADNLGTRGAALSAANRRRHALLFALEHPAVRNQREFLERQGFTVDTIPCTPDGLVDMAALEGQLRPEETALVAVMHANNEIGTLQPLEAVGELLADLCPKAHFHVDAVQSFSKTAVRPRRWNASSVALAGHKLHGPKGVGVLWLKKGARVRPLHVGGGQERGVRPGTENVPGIVGFGAAARLALEGMATDVPRMQQLRDRLFAALS